MKFRTFVAATAAATLATAPVVAADRTSAPVEGESEVGGGSTSLIIAILAAAAFIGGLYIAIEGSGDDDPISV